jgi:hypothetical protein
MEFAAAGDCVPDTEFVASTAFALAPELVPETAFAAGELELEDGVSIDVNPELIWINCCKLFTPTSCEM